MGTMTAQASVCISSKHAASCLLHLKWQEHSVHLSFRCRWKTLKRADVRHYPPAGHLPAKHHWSSRTMPCHSLPLSVKCILPSTRWLCQLSCLLRHIYRAQSYGCLVRHAEVMDESFPLPGRGAELNWKLLFIPRVSRRRIRFVCNWFKAGGGVWGSFCGGKAKVLLLMEKMIEFVLSCAPFHLLSFYPLPVSVNQIISLPCQQTLLVEQSKLICKRALWFFFFPFPLCLFLPLPFFSFLFFSPQSSLIVCLFAVSSSSFYKKGLFCCYFKCTSFDEMTNHVSSRRCLTLSQQSPATPSCDEVRSLVKGSLSTGFPL